MHIGEKIRLVNKNFCEFQLAEHIKYGQVYIALNRNLEMMWKQRANHTVKSTIHSLCLYMLFFEVESYVVEHHS